MTTLHRGEQFHTTDIFGMQLYCPLHVCVADYLLFSYLFLDTQDHFVFLYSSPTALVTHQIRVGVTISFNQNGLFIYIYIINVIDDGNRSVFVLQEEIKEGGEGTVGPTIPAPC